jgi:tetratricopeptide (TPR) repeat protein
MTKLKAFSVLAAVALGSIIGVYGVAYAVASGKGTTSDPVAQFSVPRTDYPSAETQIAFWSRRVAEEPSAYLDLTLLGQAFARKGRETSDIDYYIRAESALRRALRIDPHYVQAQALLAGVLFSVHEFRQALEIARPIVDNPRGVQALATIGDAHFALGEYDRARAAYARLLAWSATPAAYSRLAGLSSLRGDNEQAIRLMERAAQLARDSGDYGESLGWYSYQLGELSFRNGRLDDAEAHYRAALRAFAGYPLALGGLAKVKAALGDVSAAIRLYSRATSIVPLPELLAALGDLYSTSGDVAHAQREYASVQFIAKLANLKRKVYNRQLSIFYADHAIHLDAARRLALGELRVRRDVNGFDTAAWVLARSGRCREALPLTRHALGLGTRDALLYFHRGYAEGCAGHIAAMRRWYERALEVNPYFSIHWAPVVRAALDKG